VKLGGKELTDSGMLWPFEKVTIAPPAIRGFSGSPVPVGELG
jgi:hypothetical protein